MSQKQEELVFPRDKDESGRASWIILFNKAAQLPEVLDRSDRVEFSRFTGEVIRNLPCEDCKIHSFGYMKAHPPKFNTNREAVDYLCELKNDIRRNQGKSTINCSSIKIDTSNCPTCGVNANHGSDQSNDQGQDQTHTEGTAEQTQQPQERETRTQQIETPEQPQPETEEAQQRQVEVSPDLSEDFEAYKRIQTQLFENLLRKENVPIPPIFHAPCPEHENTSCVRKNNRTNKYEVYLHPGATDNRQRIHEAKHYIDLVKGQETSEESANKYALDILSNHFPLDKPEIGEADQVYADSIKEDPPNFDYRKDTDKITQEVTKKAKDEWTTYADAISGQFVPTTQNDPILGITSISPYTQQVQAEIEQRRRQEEELKKQQESGLFANLDPLFSMPAGLVGLTPQELNNATTPSIVKSAIMTLVESNTTPFGSALISITFGVMLFVAAILVRARISHRDLFGLASLSASFTWNALEYLNPKLHMRAVLTDVIKRRARLRDLIIETPKMHHFRESTPQILPIPHTAFSRAFSAGAGPADISTIRIRQNESRSRYDASRPMYAPPSGRGLTPAEERAVATPLNAGPGSLYDIPTNPGIDLYSEDYGEDVYSQPAAYVPSNPVLQQIAVIGDEGPSGY